jgi:farnesyl-diphosphate farnesyltransferase
MNRAKSAPSESDRLQQLLHGVSRSFALTIPNLPPQLCRTVTIAYLLCRIVDTIEDEESLPISLKQQFFDEFIDVVNGRAAPDGFTEKLFPLLSVSTLPAEKELIQETPVVIRHFFRTNPAQQALLRQCVTAMSTGMLQFQESKSVHGLENLSDMDTYCYHVAGVVGEMLTGLFCDYSKTISKNQEKLMALASSFGQGLQMTNILKDLWEDRARGACWLPQDIFKGNEFDLKDLSPGVYTPAFGEGLAELIGIAHGHLKNALAYSLLMPQRETGIRKFCLWAIGMAIFTLQKLNRTRHYSCGDEVKISRKTLKRIILATNATLRSNFLLQSLFTFAARGLPLTEPKKPCLQAATERFTEGFPIEN